MHPWFRVLVGDPTAGRANAGLPVPQAGLSLVEPASPAGHLLKWTLTERDGRSVVPGGLRELASSNREKASARRGWANRNDADALGNPANRVSRSVNVHRNTSGSAASPARASAADPKEER